MRMRSDAKLVELARDGSREAAAELFSRHWRSAWRAAYAITGRRELADDVAQDAFERAFAALARFDDRRPFGPAPGGDRAPLRTRLHAVGDRRAARPSDRDRQLTACPCARRPASPVR